MEGAKELAEQLLGGQCPRQGTPAEQPAAGGAATEGGGGGGVWALAGQAAQSYLAGHGSGEQPGAGPHGANGGSAWDLAAEAAQRFVGGGAGEGGGAGGPPVEHESLVADLIATFQQREGREPGPSQLDGAKLAGIARELLAGRGGAGGLQERLLLAWARSKLGF